MTWKRGRAAMAAVVVLVASAHLRADDRKAVGSSRAAANQPAVVTEMRRELGEVKQMISEQDRKLGEQARTIERQNQAIESLEERLRKKDVVAPSSAEFDVAEAGSGAVLPTLTEAALDAKVAEVIARLQAKSEQAAQGKTYEVGKDLGMLASWQHGLWLETADKAFRFHVGGRTQADAVWMDADNNVQFGPNGPGSVEDAVNFRRARLAVEGTLWEVIDFNTEYDFVNTTNTPSPGSNTPVPTDLWVTITHLPFVGNLRIGNQKPPISFEHLTSSRFLNFMERSFGFDAFIGGLDNGFRPGLQLFNSHLDDRMTWAIGVFKNTNRGFGWNVGDGEGDVTGRVTFLPYYANDGRCLVHIGMGASHRDLDDDEARFRARTLLRNGPGHLHTVLGEARMIGEDQDLLAPEVVVVMGPWTFQSEYYASFTHDVSSRITPGPAAAIDAETVFSQGYYVEALYFLTGEHRVYDKKYPRFSRVVPNENYFHVDGEGRRIAGRGAWQVGLRYSWLDLTDSGISGGELDDVTLGLNWFLNPNTKVQWNYSWAWRETAGASNDGTVQGFGTRLALDF